MPIPDFQSFFLPMLRATADGVEHPISDLRERIAIDFKLTPEELQQKVPSGVQIVFANRVAWSTVYLNKAAALFRVKRGVFRITQRGMEILGLGLPKVTIRDLAKYPEFATFQKGSQTAGDEESPSKALQTQTPEEDLENAYRVLRTTLANDVLEMVKKASPAFFERLVVDLLVAMGYGGDVENSGQIVGKSGDGGIDGIIKQDKLGLDVVYVQAKRWNGSVGRPIAQAFAGSLEGVRARKGVLITTSYFSQDALDYVKRIEKRIVLVDGNQLADLMIDHDIGVSITRTYKVKRLDFDYFEEA